MKVDFIGSLPTLSRHTFPTSNSADTQVETWERISYGISELFVSCLEERGLPGWTTISENIVVAFWPGNSVMDRLYGISLGKDLNISDSFLLRPKIMSSA